MDVLDLKPSVGGGAAGRGGGGFYHLSFRSGSRAGGASAHATYEYATREGEYGDRDLDPAVYTESDNMPSWAQEDPAEYWAAADDFERANGRLYVSADFALPQGPSAEDQIVLAHEFAHELTKDERLPYTPAIHAGRDDNGEAHNPPCIVSIGPHGGPVPHHRSAGRHLLGRDPVLRSGAAARRGVHVPRGDRTGAAAHGAPEGPSP
jgi:hypothetical protein